jgi:hypothetical protein
MSFRNWRKVATLLALLSGQLLHQFAGGSANHRVPDAFGFGDNDS